MLNIESLSLSYQDTQVIRDLDLSVKRGEALAIVGPSGAGKSTLLTYLYQQLKQDAALCSQSQGLVDALSVFHNVYMGALARHWFGYNLLNLVWPMATPCQEVQQLCRDLYLEVPIETAVSSLSGGQRQRVALARALYQQQAVFIGDESFSALDPMMAQRLLNLVKARHETVIMVLHDSDLALQNFDRIIGLSEGKLVLDQPTSQLDSQQLARFFDTQMASTPHG
ncbi:ATP-binding cassette domain-containing protein [Shewanella marisflavi]|uniref:Phosphonate ABC transporter ATP-binding protein n=1 Tax=Shewanella marisflavi TaxID=260364 RepID=A0AAC9TYX7_9GAMM|nr:ATP-binding cassette domain-containing protein [Shewanella marisflavi]ASJ96463.1 phosphonate ABC transporter ATP-binding protein [Shewanella marisflavi]